MLISVGVIGTGNIGQAHIRRIAQALSGKCVWQWPIPIPRGRGSLPRNLAGGQNLIAPGDVDAAIEPQKELKRNFSGSNLIRVVAV